MQNIEINRGWYGFFGLNKNIGSKKLIDSVYQVTNNSLKSIFKEIRNIESYFINIENDNLLTLIGKTIEPKFASAIKSKIEFDGVGKIVAIKNNKLSLKNFNDLCRYTIKPLSETHQVSKEKIMTPGEGLVNIARLIRSYDGEINNKEYLENIIRDMWLSDRGYLDCLGDIVHELSESNVENIELINKVKGVLKSVNENFYLTKGNDNYYGRLFETELSKYIVENPNQEMLNIRDAISSTIIKNFSSLHPYIQMDICEKVHAMMISDPPAWRDSLTEVNEFLNSRKPTDFIRMFKFSGNYSVPLNLSLAIKYILSSKNILDDNVKAQYSEYNKKNISSQRLLIKSNNLNAKAKTEFVGVYLPYQKPILENNRMISGKGIRPLDMYMRPSADDRVKTHDAMALLSERATGIGVSGSSNILYGLLKQLELNGENISVDDWELASAAFLCYSGGHSFNEAYSVFERRNTEEFKPVSFKHIKDLNDLSKKAVLHSYNNVIESSIKLNV